MTRKCYIPHKVRLPFFLKQGLKWVVYKWEYDRVQPTYYYTFKQANRNKNWVSC